MKYIIIPVIIWATWIATKCLKKNLEVIKVKHSIKIQQDRYTWNMTHNTESTAAWAVWIGEVQGETACDKRHGNNNVGDKSDSNKRQLGRLGCGWIESPPQIIQEIRDFQSRYSKGEEVCTLINYSDRCSPPFTVTMLSPVASVKLSHL
jgi:hypothetical protein